MSGFSPDWLALREPADHAARNRNILAQVTAHFSGRDHLSVLDLGCGAGSNLRGCALALPASHQSWTLVDYDPALLAAARKRLTAWADRTEEQGEELLVEKGGKSLTIDFRHLDLNSDLERALGWRPDLVTAAAFFDLVSPDWINRFVASLARLKLPLYTVLIYDGREEFSPADPRDADIHAAFLAHQRTDKGFGPSAGPDASRQMAKAFEMAGYRVAAGESPWRLGRDDAALAEELLKGIAGAARQTGLVGSAEIDRWLGSRLKELRGSAAEARIGHIDIWAAPAAS